MNDYLLQLTNSVKIKSLILFRNFMQIYHLSLFGTVSYPTVKHILFPM